MAKNTINILCPSGHRRKTTMTPNSNLLQALEDVCNQEDLDPSEWGLIYQRNKCDLNIQWRLQNIPTNAVLEMYQLDHHRKTDDINVQLELPDNSRYPGWFEPTVTLQEMLDWHRIQPDSMVAALDISLIGTHNSCPVCSYLGQEIVGEYALSNTTLRELGLTSGTAVIRYNLRPISDNEIQKANARIDEKISRRRQQQYENEQKSKQPQQKQQQQQQTTAPKPAPTRSSTSDTSRTLTNSAASRSNEEEYSIFRDPPPSASLPTTARTTRESLTLAEELGLNISLDLERKADSRQQQQSDFRNFKFPESSRGKELYRNESDEDYQQAQNVRPCERRPLAYDLLRNRSTRDSQRKTGDELPDSFFELTAEDLRSVLNTLQKHSTTENPLETRDMRDRAQSARAVVYEQIAIRLVINSRFVLQGFFRPEEPALRLIDFARTNLICSQIGEKDFYFYTSPPRVVLSDLRKPLLAYDLAPAAFVYLGHRTISPLKVELASNVPLRTIDEANQLAAEYVFRRSRPGSARVQSALYNERPMSATSLTARPTPRNQPTTSTTDDKRLREKFRKFLPGKK